jgi:hypothetical protein
MIDGVVMTHRLAGRRAAGKMGYQSGRIGRHVAEGKIGESFLVLFFKKEQKEGFLFEKRNKNFYPLFSILYAEDALMT